MNNYLREEFELTDENFSRYGDYRKFFKINKTELAINNIKRKISLIRQNIETLELEKENQIILVETYTKKIIESTERIKCIDTAHSEALYYEKEIKNLTELSLDSYYKRRSLEKIENIKKTQNVIKKEIFLRNLTRVEKELEKEEKKLNSELTKLNIYDNAIIAFENKARSAECDVA